MTDSTTVGVDVRPQVSRNISQKSTSMVDPEFYGDVPVIKIRAAYNELRRALAAGDIEAAQSAFDLYEQWSDYAVDPRHKPKA